MANTRNGTMIFIEDDLTAVQRFLPLFRKKHVCHYATNAQDGIALYQKMMNENPLVICDVNLPDMLGFDVCREIKSRNPATYVMLLTAYNDSELRMAGLNAYADSYVDKASSNEEICLKIRNAFNTIYLNRSVSAPMAKKATPSYRLDDFETTIRNYVLSYYKQPCFERDTDGCSLEVISAFMNQSPRTFQRKMHDQVGMPFKTYQLHLRLKMSQDLLMEGFCVTEIADILEFSSPSHLSRAFHEYYGMTPSKYKKSRSSL